MSRFWFRHDADWQRVARAGEAVSLAASSRAVARRFAVPCTASGLPGRRLVFVSDLHWCDSDPEGDEGLVAAVNELAADWFVFGGDLIRYVQYVPGAMRLLAGVQARLGKFAVLGNRESTHDWLPAGFWQREYEKAGIMLLVNAVWTGNGDEGLAVAGIDDYRYGVPDLSCLEGAGGSGRFVVLVTHSPDAVGQTTGQAVGDLVLAGHTHGGQIRLPGLGPIYTSSVYGRQFDRGWFLRGSDQARMCVSAGVGCTGWDPLRRRVLCPAEITVLDFVVEEGAEHGA